MPEDADALEELLRVSVPGIAHVILHYLYFPLQENAEKVARALAREKMQCDVRMGADDVNWLVLAKQEVVPSKEIIARTRRVMEQLARRYGGEYDGWEAEVVN